MWKLSAASYGYGMDNAQVPMRNCKHCIGSCEAGSIIITALRAAGQGAGELLYALAVPGWHYEESPWSMLL